jgi:hypothetical protein
MFNGRLSLSLVSSKKKAFDPRSRRRLLRVLAQLADDAADADEYDFEGIADEYFVQPRLSAGVGVAVDEVGHDNIAAVWRGSVTGVVMNRRMLSLARTGRGLLFWSPTGAGLDIAMEALKEALSQASAHLGRVPRRLQRLCIDRIMRPSPEAIVA